MILTAIKFSFRFLASVLLVILSLLVLSNVCPIYNFEEG